MLCHAKIKEEIVEAEYIGVFQHSDVIPPSPMIGGHTGGIIAFPVVVVKIGDKLKQVKLSDVMFDI